MNDQLQQALSQILEQTVSGVQAGVTLLSAELPDVIHQLLMWKMIESLIWCVVGILFTVGSIRWISKNSGKGKEEGRNYKATLTHDERGDIAPWSPILIVPLVIIVAIACFTINITWLQILIAPKVYLIEYAASLIK
jgi:hypothetical protein